MAVSQKEEEVVQAELEARLAEAKLRTFEAREKLSRLKADLVAKRDRV